MVMGRFRVPFKSPHCCAVDAAIEHAELLHDLQGSLADCDHFRYGEKTVKLAGGHVISLRLLVGVANLRKQ